MPQNEVPWLFGMKVLETYHYLSAYCIPLACVNQTNTLVKSETCDVISPPPPPRQWRTTVGEYSEVHQRENCYGCRVLWGWGGISWISVRGFYITMYSRIFLENLITSQQTGWLSGVCCGFHSPFLEMSGQPRKLGH
jgi:hypothetical protein